MTDHKAAIETIINTAAISISAVGVLKVQAGDWFGFVCVLFAAGLEFFKYLGRKEKYW
jgi:uncharacterized membrane protein YjjP (DUF1212 family)